MMLLRYKRNQLRKKKSLIWEGVAKFISAVIVEKPSRIKVTSENTNVGMVRKDTHVPTVKGHFLTMPVTNVPKGLLRR